MLVSLPLSLPLNDVFAVVPAGGFGTRLGSAVPKQYLTLSGRQATSQSVIEMTLQNLLAVNAIKHVVVVVAPSDTFVLPCLSRLIALHPIKLSVIFKGGATRRDSVLAGCNYLLSSCGAADTDWLLVHDAARPGVNAEQIALFIEQLQHSAVGGLMALPMADTVKRELPAASLISSVESTVDRQGLWLAQTPQMFKARVLINALRAFASATDEASAIEHQGLQPLLIMGSRLNFKITSVEDLQLMRDLVASVEPVEPTSPVRFSPAHFRIGQGYDSHALVPGRKLILGGVTIACERGLLGHSDADALLHAIIDALLGATGGGDIGRCFPDTDAALEGADSAVLLQQVYARLKGEGWSLGNVDATIIAQSPKLQSYMPDIVARVAQLLECEANQVNIKAKTNEKLGHLGRGEAIGVHAVACVFKLNP